MTGETVFGLGFAGELEFGGLGVEPIPIENVLVWRVLSSDWRASQT